MRLQSGDALLVGLKEDPIRLIVYGILIAAQAGVVILTVQFVQVVLLLLLLLLMMIQVSGNFVGIQFTLFKRAAGGATTGGAIIGRLAVCWG